MDHCSNLDQLAWEGTDSYPLHSREKEEEEEEEEKEEEKEEKEKWER